jgi:uncharacterized protein
MKRSLVLLLLCAAFALSQAPAKRVLVYTRNHLTNGKGFVHDNIETSVEALKKMGRDNGFAVDATDDPAVFTADKLKQYRVIVFSNSNNEAFENDAQRTAFQDFMKAGGGFVGIHSASGSERAWPYFWKVAGGSFRRHPKLQKFTVRVVDPTHPATKGLPASFEWEDECYFLGYMNPDLHPLLITDPTKLEDPERAKYPQTLFGNAMPLAWWINVEGGGRAFYTALGHKKEHYSDPLLVKQIVGGIQWAMGEAR